MISRITTIQLVIWLSLILNIAANAQQSRTLFFMHELPQSAYVNPAIQPNCKWFIGIPALSSLYFNGSSTGFSYNSLSPGKEYIDAESIAKRLHSIDYLTVEMQINLLALGYKRKDYYYSFNIAEKVDAKIFYPKSLINLAVYGNDELIGKKMFTKGLGAYGIHYREYSFGIAQNFESYFLWGLKGKLLFGKSNLTTKHGAISLTTEKDTYDLLSEWSYQFNVSLPLDVPSSTKNIDIDNIGIGDINLVKYLLNPNNIGFAVDYGFVYVDEKIIWSASILDFGIIRWRSDTHQFNNSGSVAFEGITVDDILNPNEFLEMIRDSINNQTLVFHSQGTYLTMLPTKVNFGATYEFHPKLNAGILLRTEFYPRRPVPSLTLSLNTIRIKNFVGSLSYSLMNGSYNNVGLGLGFGFQNLVFHIVSDNLTAFIVPHKVHTANLRFGIHMLFGCSKKGNRLPYTGPGCFWDLEKVKPKK
jgi:hypothetical protein